MTANINGIYNFGSLRLDTRTRRLTRESELVPLTPKCFDLLQVLVENRDRAVSRAELLKALWPDTEVEEGNLSFQISALRKALGPDAASWIETVPRHGYRFTAPVDAETADQSEMKAVDHRRAGVNRIAIAAAILAVAFAGFLVARKRASEEFPHPLPLTASAGSEISPSWSPNGRRVAFMWNGPARDNWDIYVKDLDSDQPVRLTSGLATEFGPEWSPDGHRLAYGRQLPSTEIEIVVRPFPNGPEQTVGRARSCFVYDVHPDKFLDWHTDGDRLVVSGLEGGRGCGLSLLSTSTGRIAPVTDAGANIRDTAPTISPDGRFIAFARGSTWPNFAVHTVTLADTASGPVSAERLTSEQAMELWPAWTANSRELVFSSGTSAADISLYRASVGSSSKPRRIATLDLSASFAAISHDGRIVYGARPPMEAAIQNLDLSVTSSSTTEFAASTHVQQSPVHSPDGQQVAFESERSGFREIWISSTDGAQIRQLTRFQGRTVQSPQWSPDGSRIVFTVAEQGQRRLYVISAHGGTPTRVEWDGGDSAGAAFCADAKFLYASADRSGEYEIWKVPVEGGEAVQLTKLGGRNPRVSPDGRYVYFARVGPTASLWRLPAAGGPETRLSDALLMPVGISAVNDGVYFVGRPEVGDPAKNPVLWFVDAQTQRIRKLTTLPGPVGWGLSIAPKGKSLLYVRDARHTFDLKVAKLPD